MSLDEDVYRKLSQSPAERSDLPTALAEIAEDVCPGFWAHRKAPEYREDVTREFLENDGREPQEYGPYRPLDERRLLDTWTQVANEHPISEATIRDCVLRMYEDADPEELGHVSQKDEMTAMFLEHLRDIEARWERHEDNQ